MRRAASARMCPTTVRFRKKWQIALHLLQQVRASGITITGGAERFRLRRRDHVPDRLASLEAALRPRRLGDADRVSRAARSWSCRAAVRGRGSAIRAPRWERRRRRSRSRPWPRRCPPTPGTASRGRTATSRTAARCVPRVRVTPAHDWQHGRLLPEIWLLIERPDDRPGVTKYYFVNLPRRTALGSSRALRPSAVAHRAAIPTTEDRTRARSLRRPHLSRLESPRRRERGRLCLPAAGTPAPRHRRSPSKPSTRSCRRSSSASSLRRGRATPVARGGAATPAAATLTRRLVRSPRRPIAAVVSSAADGARSNRPRAPRH